MILLFLEPPGEVTRGLLTEGHRIASLLHEDLSVITLEEVEEDLTPYDLVTHYRIDLDDESEEAGAWAIHEVLKDIPFTLLLFAHTGQGSGLAPRVAWYLGTSCVTECVDIIVRDGAPVFETFLYGDQFSREVSCAKGPRIATMRPDLLNIRPPGGMKVPALTVITLKTPSDLPRTKVLDRIPPDYRTVDILYAKRIIGVGLGAEEVLPMVEELSHLLECSIGATRPVMDDGHIPRDRMIGQTGKTVAPDLYIALGLSGSPHHVAGIQGAKTILSVNHDPKAPVFTVSDRGFAGDLHEILPRLIARIKASRDHHV